MLLAISEWKELFYFGCFYLFIFNFKNIFIVSFFISVMFYYGFHLCSSQMTSQTLDRQTISHFVNLPKCLTSFYVAAANSICAPSSGSSAVSQLLGNKKMLFVWVHEVQIKYQINSRSLLSRWYAKTFSSEVSDISTANTSRLCTCVWDTRGIFMMYFIA